MLAEKMFNKLSCNRIIVNGIRFGGLIDRLNHKPLDKQASREVEFLQV